MSKESYCVLGHSSSDNRCGNDCLVEPTYTASQVKAIIEDIAVRVENVEVPTEGVNSNQNQEMWLFKDRLVEAIREMKI